MKLKHIYLYNDVSKSYVVARGPQLADWLKAAGIPAMWIGLDRGFRVRRERVPNVLAAAQDSGTPVSQRGGL